MRRSGEKETDNRTDNIKKEGDGPISRRKSEIGGQHFSVIRHFSGEKELGALMAELARRRADREMRL